MIRLLKKSAKFTWGDECQSMFEQLKEMLVPPPILRKSDTTIPILVYIIAIKYTISATLV